MTHDRNEQSSLDELRQQNAQLEAVCRLWIAANDAKEARITRLEGRVMRLRRHVWRLRHLLGSRPSVARAKPVQRMAHPR